MPEDTNPNRPQTTPLSMQIDQILVQARQAFNRKHQRLIASISRLKRQARSRAKAQAARKARKR